MKKLLLVAPILTIVATVTILMIVPKNELPIEDSLSSSGSTRVFHAKQPLPLVKEKSKVMRNPEHPDKFAEYHSEIRRGANGASYPMNYRMTELNKAYVRKYGADFKSLRKQTGGDDRLPWLERGPSNVSGRTRTIVVDLAADASGDTWFAGGVSGGIWKTLNAGLSWRNLTPGLPNLQITWLVMAPSSDDVMYAATGEGWLPAFADLNGDGIFKSTDRGENWAQLASTTNEATARNFRNVSRLIIDPDNENIVLASTSAGIFKTIDGGGSWNQVYTPPAATFNTQFAVQQIIANPKNFNSQFASVYTLGVLKSIDGGDSWTESLTDFTPPIAGGVSGRIELAIAPTDTNRIYGVLDQQTGSTTHLYMSKDAGDSWVRVNDISGTNPNMLSGQGWYDNTITVHPFSEDTVYVGGVRLFRVEIQQGAAEDSLFAVSTNNTSSFLSFVNFGGSLAGGGVEEGVANGFPQTTFADFDSIEIRFGPGLGQKAHRFGFFSEYIDYVDVPFEVWNIETKEQLMVAFQDTDDDTTFDLRAFDGGNLQREYIVPTALPYDADNPVATIADSATTPDIFSTEKGLFFIWPILASGGAWDPDNLPESSINLYYGRITVAQMSANQFASFGNPGVPHVDNHHLSVIPFDEASNSFRLMNGNDGGVWYTNDDGQTWVTTNNGYNTTQFYGADKRPGVSEYIGGTQDNGTWQSPAGIEAARTTKYTFRIGGDGFDAVYNAGNGLEWIGGAQNNSLAVTRDGGNTFRFFDAAEVNAGSGPFITILANTKSNPELVMAVSPLGVHRTDNFGRIWALTPIAEPGWAFNGSATEIAQSIANPQIVWAGARMNSASSPNGRVQVSVDGGISFVPVNAQYEVVNLPLISGIETHPTQDSTVFVLFSAVGGPKVLRTTDLGNSWQDLSGFDANDTSDNGFPDVAVHSLLVLPHQLETIWAGTEIGIVESTDNGQTWALAFNGLPAVVIWQMRVVDDQIVVATHGRGIWTLTVPEIPPPPSATLPPRINAIAGGGRGLITLTAEFRSGHDSSFVVVDGQKIVEFPFNDVPFDTTLTVTVPVTELTTALVHVVAYLDGLAFRNADFGIQIFPLSEAVAGFSTDFTDTALDSSRFLLNGFDIGVPAGFENPVIQTLHPYPNSTELTALLTSPIIVSSTDAFLRYDDIAVVENGLPGAPFGTVNFFDFVVVEGSRDNGVSWLPLGQGYDATFDSTSWLATFNAGGAGDPSMFRSHEIDLLDTFSANDEIIVRFRLFADPGANGWGWVIDNLAIQQEPVSVRGKDLLPTVFSLSANYPNPFNPSTNINYALPRASEVNLKIYNVLGQLVRGLVRNEKQGVGSYTVQWDGKDDLGTRVASGVYIYRIEAEDFLRSRKMLMLK